MYYLRIFILQFIFITFHKFIIQAKIIGKSKIKLFIYKLLLNFLTGNIF